MINTHLDGGVFIYNQWILEPFEELDLGWGHTEIEFSSRQLPQESDTAPAWPQLVQQTDHNNYLVNFQLSVGEYCPHIQIA